MATPVTVNDEFDIDPLGESLGNWEDRYQAMTHKPGDLPAETHHFSIRRGSSYGTESTACGDA